MDYQYKPRIFSESERNMRKTKGYSQVIMNDVTQASGMSAGGLYYHYRTVGDIVKEILTAETNDVWESIGSPQTPYDKKSFPC